MRSSLWRSGSPETDLMKNREIYENALRLLAQPTDGEENEDYEERAPYLIASCCSSIRSMDRLLREATDGSASKEFGSVWLSLTDDFPLLEQFAPAVCLFVAAMLVIDEDGVLSDTLYDRYCDLISTLQTEIPAIVQSIKNKYF